MRVVCILLVPLLLLAPDPVRAGAPRPNIILIVADDLGYADLGFLPQSPGDVSTPALDRLAAEGTYFSNAYATSPICSPSRTGLVTGRYQQRWGNYWYGQGGLPLTENTLPKSLRKLGYRTLKIGKTHLNGGAAQHPLDHGFERHLGFIHHTWDYIRLHQKDVDAYKDRSGGNGLGILNVGPLIRGRDEKVSYEDGFTTEIFTGEAIKEIRAGSDRPFFVQLSYNAVHMPTYVTDPKYAKRAGYEQPEWDRDADRWEFPFWDPSEMTWGAWHKKWGHLGAVDGLGRKRYLANLMAMDDGIGKILATLDETKKRDNTIIVFLSDNGGTINTYSNNTPLRGYKYMFGEGGIRIPIIVSWPGKLPAGKIRSSLTSSMDLFPTLLDLLEEKPPENLDGKSLLSSLEDAEVTGQDHLCWADGKGTWAVRQGPWKLIQSKGWSHTNFKLDAKGIAAPAPDSTYPEGLLLFNLDDDIGETKNVADEHPETVAQLRSLFDGWRSEMAQPGGNRKPNKPKSK